MFLKYKHLSLEERVELYSQVKLGISLRVISQSLGRTHSSLSRELKRHAKYGRPYKPVLANKRALRWAAQQRYKAPLKNPQILVYVLHKLRLGWGPEIIAGRIGIDYPGLSTSYESIYRWIYSRPWKKHKLWKYLEYGHQRRRKKHGCKVATYTQVLDSKSIDFRPNEINMRQVVGHGETDLMESGRDGSTALSVTVDRLTRITSLTKIKDKTSRSKAKTIIKPAPAGLSWLSITADRGSENKGYQIWEVKLGIQVYFCHAYHSWEKGTVENTIKRIRRFIPKGEDINNYSKKEIHNIQEWINNKPMKCLQYLTPYERMSQVQEVG